MSNRRILVTGTLPALRVRQARALTTKQPIRARPENPMRRAIVARDFALSSEHGPVPSRDFV